jgi:hypothetical protein
MSYNATANELPDHSYILIAETIEDDYPEVEASAQELGALFAGQPQAGLETVVAVRQVLEDPHVKPDRLNSLNLDPQRQKIAQHIAGLLDRTEHGRYIFFSDEVYDLLDGDKQHEKLVHNVQIADKRNQDNLAKSHRQVVLSGLTAVAHLYVRSAEATTSNTAGEGNDVG